MRTCKNCGKNIDGMKSNAVYCSRRCKDNSGKRGTTTAMDRIVGHANRLGLLTLEQEHELGFKAMDGDVEARNKLVEHNMKVAVSYARKAAVRSVSMDDAMAGAVLGMVIAADRYDPRKLNPGAKFITYAKWWIMAQMQFLCYDRGAAMSFPRNTARLHTGVGQIVGGLACQGAHPERALVISEIVKRYDCTTGVANSAYDGWVAEMGTLSMDYMAAGEDTDMHNTLVCSTDPIDIDTGIDAERITGYAYQVLKGREFAAFMLRYFGEDDLMSLRDIADRLSCSREGARQMIDRAEDQIRRAIARERATGSDRPERRTFSLEDVEDEISRVKLTLRDKVCAHCGNEYQARNELQLYCSTECNREVALRKNREYRERQAARAAISQ
jgi:RNA polymerase nonessential primary-like sigma factor